MNELVLIALSEERDLSGFDCGNDDMNQWLVRHAWASHKADLARTWLALDGGIVAGYFALTTGSVRPEDAPRRVARGMPRYPIPIILLARLAVDVRHQGQRLGPRLLAEALRRAVAASDTAAARLVVVDAIDDTAPSTSGGVSSTHPTTRAASTAGSPTSAPASPTRPPDVTANEVGRRSHSVSQVPAWVVRPFTSQCKTESPPLRSTEDGGDEGAVIVVVPLALSAQYFVFVTVPWTGAPVSTRCVESFS
jgi:GNAT superfamily N-acetyltransferase